MFRIFLFTVFFTSCAKYPQDNFVEEIAEEVIRAETGMDIDLSPGTPEK